MESVKSWTTIVSVALCDREPLVPVIVTEYGPGVKELHDIVAVPELRMLDGAIVEHVNPGAILSVRVTEPENPFTADIETVMVADDPALTAAGEFAEIVKSVTMNLVVTECESVPLTPVTVKSYVPALELEHESE